VRTLIVFLVLLHWAAPSIAQQINIPFEKMDLQTEDKRWFIGTITLTNGTVLKGNMRFSEHEGFVIYQEDEQNNKVYTAMAVTTFQFRDSTQARIFYSLPYVDSESSSNQPQIFEVIREYETFAILLKTDRTKAEQKALQTTHGAGTPGPPTPSNQIFTYTETSQVQTVFFMDDSGTINPYIKVTHKENGLRSITTFKDRKSKSKMLDEDLLEQYVTPASYKKLQAYAKENGYKFKIREDFLKILEYYDTIKDEI
jgi:hypothetical protein